MSQTTATAVGTTHQRPVLRPSKIVSKSDEEKAALHPSVLAEAEHRAGSIQLRVADAITTFAGSMWFVYLHVVLFAAWMLFFEKSPWPTLTLIVSLEAIFLSTFVMIGQNRQASFQQAKADHDYQASESLLTENTDLTRAIHQLTAEIHKRVLAEVTASLSQSGTLSPEQAAQATHDKVVSVVATAIAEHKVTGDRPDPSVWDVDDPTAPPAPTAPTDAAHPDSGEAPTA